MPEGPASIVVPLAGWGIAGRGRGGPGGSGGSGGSQRSQRILPGPPGLPGPPWFVWVHLFDPHAPYRPPPPFDTQYSSQPYYGEVAAVDAPIPPRLHDLRPPARATTSAITRATT